MSDDLRNKPCSVAVIWIDWYAYHVARFRGLDSAPSLHGRTVGLEMVGGIGVHAGLKFREELPEQLAIETLMPETSWHEADKLQLARRIWHRLSELDPEVVLVPGYYTLPAIAAAVWARVHGVASVLMTESCAMDHGRAGWKEWMKGLGIRALFNWAVTGGKLHVDYLHELGFPADRIAGCYDVVDNEAFRSGTAALRAASSAASFSLPADNYFLYTGRLAHEKNVAGLIASWSNYRQAGGTWSLVLVGDGPKRAELESLAAQSGFGHDVLFAGLRTSAQLLPYYAFAGCFVLPSTLEPWGLVVNEAMAAGLPVIVSERCGCAADLVVDGRNGFIFNPADESELTVLLIRMEQMGAERRAEMGCASEVMIQNFSPERFGRSVAAIAAAARGTQRRLETIAEGSR